MIAIPQNQREKHPELYPLPKDKDQYINHIYEMCDKANGMYKKRKLSQIVRIKLFFLLIILGSCASLKEPLYDIPCTVISKKYVRSVYYDFKCLTLYSKEPVYLVGFKEDAYPGDTVIVAKDYYGFRYFKKSND